ncbi:aminopeptidase N [Lucilia sericata]|uniref:aminopeptidase N n=1 Tax=Lucilia sericata TaxID=13632 RepID=UPI0018A87341|nr:aminopeptidase N [Lucilia sericata]XP_037815961.1 aminopeptidase N [Lucilia sericata]
MQYYNLIVALLVVTHLGNSFSVKIKRSIDLSASHALIPDARLSKDVLPGGYKIDLRPNMKENTFTGSINMNLSWSVPTRKISLHAHFDLEINERSIKLSKISYNSGDADPQIENIPVLRGDRMPKKTVFVIYLKDKVNECTHCELKMDFEGNIWESTEGLFKGSYSVGNETEKITYLATYMRPNNARRLFPCFDEPGFKVPFTVSISRPRDYVTLFNTPLLRTDELPTKNNEDEVYVLDHFETTPPMSTFTFGFVISQLEKYVPHQTDQNIQPNITIWSTPDLHSELEDVYVKLTKIYNCLNNYFNVSIPLSKIDVLAIPGLASVRPADNWGLLMFKDRELLKRGYYGLTQEMIYQWLGSWVTPYWWSDAHVNKALASFLAANIVLEIDNGIEFNGKYPMTVLYSLYYEFSKRYPHSRITGMKQETTSYKTELVIRMLNYTLGGSTFQAGIRKFIADRHYGTFFGDDLWDALTKQAILDQTLPAQYSIAEIAGSWITKDRLPVINVERDYAKKMATISQKVYLRERPHDVPERDKMLWWIPLVIIQQQNLNFSNTKPQVWIEKKRSQIINDLPNSDKFIIINPEEIGPFPVNYDTTNWNLLSTFLQTEEGLKYIPTYTRAKLLHDAWNLAYAGDLSFATALNMTLFMKFERNHIVWNPVFTFIDHIGRHIDMSDVHKKFETYVRVLLTPLYEELSEPNNNETWQIDLKSIAETFLCRAGYKPCIEVAQQAFKLWMDSPNPDEQILVPNQFICPVFKWGTIEEWEFGLERVINFPKTRIQSERTYLLKTLAGCPVQPEKINRLLNITILENNANFTENDIFLIFNMLTGGSSGYTTLFNFLSNNWDVIRQRFENKSNLWNSLIGSATGVFTTKEGHAMVQKLYDDHKEEFGSALHIIEKSLRNIKEEEKWSDENLPVIENWLDEFLARNKNSENKFFE